MRNRYQSAWRRRTQGSRAARLTVTLAIPVALGVVVGGVIAFYGGSHTTNIEQTALGASPSASAEPMLEPPC